MATTISNSDIAVIGMSCRVAGANSPTELWDVLATSKNVQREITRFNIDGFYHPEGGPRKGLTNVKDAYMLDDNIVDKFDNAFFYTTPQEAMAMDPQQRMLLEIAYEAIENAGILLEDFVGTDTAVYAGMEGCDYHTILARDLDATPRYLATGTPTCMAANRLSYFFNLSGPSMSVDTACSSSMAALHQAVRTLQHGDCAMALVCSAKLILNPDMFMPSSELGFLSPSGKCKSFDAAGDGYGRGEGVFAILLKPLKSAIADGDPVRSVIKGTRLNQDGRTQGISLPSATAQKANMEGLYDELGIQLRDIQYLEAHGTGTAAGDPIELDAITSLFEPALASREALIVGSVKGSIGHLEACSALASLVKTTLCLERGLIPPQMHFKTPNPKIDFTNVVIPTGMTPWPGSCAVRTAAINTFGAGGTNGHAVLESYPVAKPETQASSDRPLLFKLSSADEHSLKAICVEIADYVIRERPNIYDLAQTLLSRRSNLRKSITFTARTPDEVVGQLRSVDDNIETKANDGAEGMLFVFTGQGAQWPQMGKALLDGSPLFESIILECDRILASLPDKPSWTIREEISRGRDSTNIYKAQYAQPLCTALQLGLVTVLDSWGLQPTAVVGHSSGEIASAYAAGLISLEEAIINAYYRGLVSRQVLNSTPPEGSMCAIGVGEDEARQILVKFMDRVQLAAINSPSSCTLSGDHEAIMEIINICKREGHFCRKLRVEVAYHSHHMLPSAANYKSKLARIRTNATKISQKCKMFSSVTGLEMKQGACTPEYWSQNMISTVGFLPAIEVCHTKLPELARVIELGPHPALKGPAMDSFRSIGRTPVEYFSTCSRGENDFVALLLTMGSIISQGVRMKSCNINAREVMDGSLCKHEYGKVLTDLPSYQWNHSPSFWAESRLSSNIRFRRHRRHQLLGSRYVDDIPQRPSWRNQLILKEIPWLAKLKEIGTTDMPPTVYIYMALEAARQVLSSNQVSSFVQLSDMRFHDEFSLDVLDRLDAPVEIQLIATKGDEAEKYGFEILSQCSKGDDENTHWRSHCAGNFEKPQFSLTDTELLNQPSSCERSPCSPEQANDNYGDVLHKVKLTTGNISGHFFKACTPSENYKIDPRVFDAVLALPPWSLSGNNLPISYRMRSIGSLIVQSPGQAVDAGQFSAKVGDQPPYGIKSNIQIGDPKTFIHINDVIYRASHISPQMPKMESLFFKPVLLPDVTKLRDFNHGISLSKCIEWLMHKWPMCDLGILGVSPSIEDAILNAIDAQRRRRRSSPRCIYLERKESTSIADGLKHVDILQEGQKYHLLFTEGGLEPQEVADKVFLTGLVCAPMPCSPTEEDEMGQYFHRICNINFGPINCNWQLWRKKHANSVLPSGTQTISFGNISPQFLSALPVPVTNSILLEPHAIAQFCENANPSRLNAVVIDNPDKSIISSWSGGDLVPWLQALLKSADSIFWITTEDVNSPFHGMAGTLLRTLQAEQPSLKVCWFLSDKNRGGTSANEQYLMDLRDAYMSMLEGQNEARLDYGHAFGPDILRYHTDDELACLVGAKAPRQITSRLEHLDYELSFAAPRQPVTLSRTPGLLGESSDDEVEVDVEASVIGPLDIQAYDGCINPYQSSMDLGFFAGIVRKDTRGYFEQGPQGSGAMVLGQCSNPHQKRLRVPYSNIMLKNSNQQPYQAETEAISVFAAIAVSTCIVDGVARAREGDTFELRVAGVLAAAMRRVCDSVGAIVLDPGRTGCAGFVVEYHACKGILVNGSPLDLKKYLTSDRGRAQVSRNWKSIRMCDFPANCYGMEDYTDVFREDTKARKEPYSSTILHEIHCKELEHVPVYAPQLTLFSAAAQYILIGGLGGLGRFICSWMVEHGAKNLNVISRSANASRGFEETDNLISSAGGSFQAFKADACDRDVMREILSTIRSHGPIKGIINLAMVLGDAPMAKMTGEEWDRALRVKIASSWILHEETMDDELDHFILFSSIASVLGNRNQGNYNVANTFLNALAEYRQGMGRTGVSVALGAMTDMGVLYNLSKPNMREVLTRSGLSHLTSKELAKIMEAAILASARRDRPLIVTGLEMFTRDADNNIVGRKEPLFWTELPEFAHLQTYQAAGDSSGTGLEKAMPLKEQVKEGEAAKEAVRDAFLDFVAQLSGFKKESIEEGKTLWMYGIDSLNGVSCQYWFHRELEVDVPVSKILSADSIAEIITFVCGKLEEKGKE